jgi:hypothetical protein
MFPALAAAPSVHSGQCRVLRHNTDERKVRRGFNSDREAGRVELTVRVVGGAFFMNSGVGKWLRSVATRKAEIWCSVRPLAALKEQGVLRIGEPKGGGCRWP